MAKTIVEELTNYRAWQLEKYGNIIPDIDSTPEGDLFESGLEEIERLAEWISRQSEYGYMVKGMPVIPMVSDIDNGRWVKVMREKPGKLVYLNDNINSSRNKSVSQQ